MVAALVAGCEEPSLDVGPPEPEDEGGKADGASSGKTELKVTIAPSHIRRARSRLGLLNAESQTRRIWFYDTAELALYDAGVIVRAREIDGEDDDSTIKLRPFTLADLGPEFAANDDMKCEVDRDPDSAASACSLKVDVDEGAIVGVGRGEHQIRTLFDSAQEAYLAAHGPMVGWNELAALGPIAARVWEIRTEEVPAKVTAELWYMPDGTQVLELSMKVKDAEADAGMQALLDFAAGRELALDAEQESKTRRALQALSPVSAP